MNPNPLAEMVTLLNLAPQVFVAVDAALQQRSVKSITELRAEVLRWRDECRPEIGDSECERLVRWLNRNFYNLRPDW
jgi:hypothetical protein